MRNTFKLVGFLLFAMPALTFAQGMSLEQIADLSQVGNAQLSPDGERIAYLRSVPRDIPEEEDGPAWSELHVIENGESRPVITGQDTVDGLGWHPGSRLFVFLEKRGDNATTRLY